MTRSMLFGSCASLAMLVTMAAPAAAQDAAPAATPAPSDTLQEIVVTASTGDRKKLDTSVSISSVPESVIEDFHPMSEGDLLRLLPGLQPNVSGPGGNGNFAVRGLPVTTGGAPFVQLQEDGLPFVLFGDIQFGNNDYFTKSSPTDTRVEDIRGGTASTFASQAPGAVVNYISKTNRSEGGYIDLEKGVNYDYTRVKLLYSGVINDSTYYNVGGYYDVGHGPKHAPYNVSNSWLIKGNITKDFDDNRGYLRLLFKVADTHEPNDTGGPACGNVTTTNSSAGTAIGHVTGFTACPGFDGRKKSIYSLYNANVSYVDFNSGGLASHPLDGISTKQKAIQAQLHYKFDNGVTFDDNMRYASISGGFASNFYNTGTVDSLIGSTKNGSAVAQAVYALGPNAGKPVADTYYNNNVNVWTNIRSLNNFVNDAKINFKNDLGDGAKLNLTAGWFFDSQQIAMDWHPNQFNDTISGIPIDLYDAAGNLLSANGYTGYNNNWGGGAARTYDYTFTDNAPYADLIVDYSQFELDASIRHDINHGSGSGTSSSGTAHSLTQTAPDPAAALTKPGATQTVNVPYLLPDGGTEVVNYTKPTTSWSVGASFKPTPDFLAFIRASKGVRANADRLTFGSNFNGDGSLSTAGQIAATDKVYQYEIGLKNGGNFAGGHYTAELTVFKGHFNVTTYELSQTVCPIITGSPTTFTCVEADNYKTWGIESYNTLRFGGLNLITNFTFNKAREQLATNPQATYHRAYNIPSFQYSIAANYDFVKELSGGLVLAGATSTHGVDEIDYPGSAIVSANLKVTPIEHLQFGLNVYNLFNTYSLGGATASTGNSASYSGPFVGSASFANGRMFTADVKFTF